VSNRVLFSLPYASTPLWSLTANRDTTWSIKRPLTLTLPRQALFALHALQYLAIAHFFVFIPLRMDFPSHSLPDLAPAYLPELELSHEVHHNALPDEQLYGLYGVDRTSAFTMPVQLSDGQVAITQNNALHPFNLSAAHPSHAQFDIGFTSNSQSVFTSAPAALAEPASPMGPPNRPRKRKAATLRADDWEPYKKRILDLHIVQKNPLPKVRQIIEEEYGFKAEYVASIRAR
jgi:hypothetical protein